jgi:hypothetical protein
MDFIAGVWVDRKMGDYYSLLAMSAKVDWYR